MYLITGVAVIVVFLCSFHSGAPLPAEPKEEWGYVKVRDDANMFWWLYYADSPYMNFKNLPLVMWLQGGPGGSGCGFGNFGEIGPLDSNLKPRNATWVQAASVLFVDNPVGTGYSYTTNSEAFAKNVTTVASDMVVLLKEFFQSKVTFQAVPFYIFSESYGGKMAAAISLALNEAVQKGTVKCNFSGVALGDSWISPLDSVLSWGPYLYSTSLLDDQGLEEVTAAAKNVQNAVEKGDFSLATMLWSEAENVVESNTDNVNFYNILKKDVPESTKAEVFPNVFLASQYHRHVKSMHTGSLDELMNGPIRKKLGVIPDSVTWGGQSKDVFSNMAEDFMKPVVSLVDKLLASNTNVTVYNGQLDLIVDTIGQEAWIKKLRWSGVEKFKKLKWSPLYTSSSDSGTAAFYKSYQNFAFFWILKAGHMIPSDQGEIALKMLRMVTNQEKA